MTINTEATLDSGVTLIDPTPANAPKAKWSAIFSLFLGVTGLIAGEFIPISLLTPIAADMGVTEGMAGQSVTAVGVFAVIASLLLAPLTGTIDRRRVLLTFSALFVASNIIVALAPNYIVMLIGRALLGVCVGGFWSLSAAVVLQLAPPRDFTRALSVVYAGVSVATIIALPLASVLGETLGWRGVFLLAGGLGVGTLIWQFMALPSMPAREGADFKSMFGLLRRRWVLTGVAATILSYAGYHVFFTYLRPFLQHDLALSAETLPMVLLAFGVANILGTVAAGVILNKAYRSVMIGVHVALALVAGALLAGHGVAGAGIGLTIAWGFIFGFIPVGWSTWIARTLADKAEVAGGLSVAAIQLSIGLAAAIGGMTFDRLGIDGVFVAAVLFLLPSVALIFLSFSFYRKLTGRAV